ncbi:MAG: hypothetical protein FWD34_09810 [Oscillospiraceae bacterium]|nr:hypothetical protein [Oscillospiraceae bacterium]
MNTCSSCGSQIELGVAQCPNCGIEIKEDVQPQFTQQPPPQTIIINNTKPASPPGKGLAIAAMILGIVSLLSLPGGIVGDFIIPGSGFVFGFFGLVGAIVGLVLGVIGMKKMKDAGAPTGMALAGIIMCGILLALNLISVICTICVVLTICGACGASGGAAVCAEMFMYM